MKKVATLIICISLFGSLTKLSAQEFENGTNAAQATIGFPQLVGFGPAYTTTIPALGLAYDRGIIDGLINGNASIGVGGYFGVAGSKTEYFAGNQTYGYKYTYVLLGARGTFHYHFIDNFDTYAGILVGGQIVSSSYYGSTFFGQNDAADSSGPLAGAFVGGRYYFTDSFAAVAELGYGVAVLNIGASFRF